MQTPRSALFLDRDGVIIADAGYVSRPEQVELLEGAAQIIRTMNARQVPVVVVTNQSGLARGLFEERDLEAVNAKMMELLRADGAHIDAMFVCPHHPQGSVARWSYACSCRKPNPGLLYQAASELGLDLSRSALIGDRPRDIAAGNTAGCKTILLNANEAREDDRQESIDPHIKVKDLHQALLWLEREQVLG